MRSARRGSAAGPFEATNEHIRLWMDCGGSLAACLRSTSSRIPSVRACPTSTASTQAVSRLLRSPQRRPGPFCPCWGIHAWRSAVAARASACAPLRRSAAPRSAHTCVKYVKEVVNKAIHAFPRFMHWPSTPRSLHVFLHVCFTARKAKQHGQKAALVLVLLAVLVRLNADLQAFKASLLTARPSSRSLTKFTSSRHRAHSHILQCPRSPARIRLHHLELIADLSEGEEAEPVHVEEWSLLPGRQKRTVLGCFLGPDDLCAAAPAQNRED